MKTVASYLPESPGADAVMKLRFYHRWIVANVWSEAAGLGTTFLLGRLVAPRIEGLDGVLPALGGAFLAVLLGVILEGALVGIAQEKVLRSRLPRVRPGSWVRATMVGAGVAWFLGMIPSTIMALAPASSGPSSGALPPLVQYGLAVGLGLTTGPILGLAQWTTLRRHVPRAARWLAANALAWAAGMGLIFFGMDRVPWSEGVLVMGLSLYFVCAVVGGIVGAIHGRVLDHMTAPITGASAPA